MSRPTTPQKLLHFPALTGLRFVLAMWVILHHLTGRGMMLEQWSQSLPQPLSNLLGGGFLAVGTFFVLSGFVLARAYQSPHWSGRHLLSYGIGRFARVYPVYILSLAVMLPFMFESSVHGKAGVVASHGLLLQGWVSSLPVSWNTPAWSLSCEIFFYLCFPLCAMAGRRLSLRGAIAVTAAVCLLPTILHLAGVPNAWRPLFHFADFMMGIVTARVMDLLLQSRKQLQGRGAWLYLPAGLAAVLAIAFPFASNSVISLNSVMRPLNALILLGLALGGGFAAGRLSTGLAVYLGKASYSMYILHIPLLWWFRRLGPPMLADLAGAPGALVYVTGVVGISAAVFRYVEEPSNAYLRKRILRCLN